MIPHACQCICEKEEENSPKINFSKGDGGVFWGGFDFHVIPARMVWNTKTFFQEISVILWRQSEQIIKQRSGCKKKTVLFAFFNVSKFCIVVRWDGSCRWVFFSSFQTNFLDKQLIVSIFKKLFEKSFNASVISDSFGTSPSGVC